MSNPNPFAPPKSEVIDLADQSEIDIDSLPISDSWKKRFKAIQMAGGPSLSNLNDLPREERKKARVAFNIFAFLFGPLYYIAKGMWKKAISLFVVCTILVIALEIALTLAGFKALGNAVGYGVAAIFAIRANLDYYKKMVLRENGWW